VPNVSCTSCGLSSYAVIPHSTASLCPYCDADLFPRVMRPGPSGAAAAAAVQGDVAGAGADASAAPAEAA
jgi:hypothetical protein